jgi:TctA family transporter
LPGGSLLVVPIAYSLKGYSLKSHSLAKGPRTFAADRELFRYTWDVTLWIVAAIVFMLNLPFGYWRARVRRYSTQWLLAIHLPVPMVIICRLFSGLGWHLATFPVMIGAFFLGQFLGGRFVTNH